MVNSSKKHEHLFKQYLKICNQALDENKNRFPYNHLWDAAQKLMEDEIVQISIYDDRPKIAYCLQFKDHHIEAVKVSTTDKSDSCCINMSYLEQVVEEPEKYIENPAKIDWDWLRNNLD